MGISPTRPQPVAANRVVILGAGRGVRGPLPSAVVDIDERGRVLDWLLDAFRDVDADDVSFVAGFRSEEVVERYPSIRTVVNRDWARTGAVQSLGLAGDGHAAQTYVCYGDVVFRRAAVESLRAAPGDVAIAIDTAWRARYDRRVASDLLRAEKVHISQDRVVSIGTEIPMASADGEFAGVLRLGHEAADAAFGAIRAGLFPPDAMLPALIRWLVEQQFVVTTVDLRGDWAELDAKQDLARFVLGTKAESLARLRSMDHGGEIDPLVAFTLGEWQSDPAAVVSEILASVPGEPLIIRSSALREDGWLESRAGAHNSIANVERDPAAIAAAVDAVFMSYGTATPDDQVLVQRMLRGVAISGVVMTRTHAIGAPYYVINFDDSSSRTDTVTAGGSARTVFVHRGAMLRPELPRALSDVIQTVQNIEKLVGHDSLDIEFAVTRAGSVHVLQVRPIAVTHIPEPIDDAAVAAAVEGARRRITEHEAPAPGLLGRSTQYSVMTDWNPAEIIGTTPKRLALSLYRYLVTDEVWARQRAEYGYRDVRPCRLLVDFAGRPYVDVRATFNSFVPADLPVAVAERLVDHYLDRLASAPMLHDKVEFDVLFTCLTPQFGADASRLYDAGFSRQDVDDLEHALRNITVRGFERLARDLEYLPAIDAAIEQLSRANCSPLERAFNLLELVRRRGTPTFAHLARAAFVATALLRAFESGGLISADEQQSFLSSIESVLGRMRADAMCVKVGTMTFSEFVRRYGHLRPGTYDIASPCYASDPETYLRPLVEQASEPAPARAAAWNKQTCAAVSSALDGVGLPSDVDRLQAFLRGAISGREEAKFVFTKALSAALECFAEFGEAHGLQRDDLAHLRAADLLECDAVMPDLGGFLYRRVREGREAYHVTQGLCLPAHIGGIADLGCFEQQAAEPNFVTRRAVTSATSTPGSVLHGDVEGTIVLIPSADPGYDWLLARDIAGLVTMYGGANSHMAVRAAEMQMPAAIGVGEVLFERVSTARVLHLDCASRTISVVG
jgi:choline kinase